MFSHLLFAALLIIGRTRHRSHHFPRRVSAREFESRARLSAGIGGDAVGGGIGLRRHEPVGVGEELRARVAIRESYRDSQVHRRVCRCFRHRTQSDARVWFCRYRGLSENRVALGKRGVRMDRALSSPIDSRAIGRLRTGSGVHASSAVAGLMWRNRRLIGRAGGKEHRRGAQEKEGSDFHSPLFRASTSRRS